MLRSLRRRSEPNFADFRRRQQVGHLEIGLRGIGHQRERIVRLAQESGVLTVRQSAAGVAHRLGQQHVGGHVGPPAAQILDHAAGVGRDDAAAEQPASLHHLMAGVVDGRGGVKATADERKLVGQFGVQRQDFGNLDPRGRGVDRFERPANLGRGLGLHVEQVELARRAEVEDHDHRVFAVIAVDRPAGLGSHQFGKRQADGTQRADLEEIATGHAVAGMGRALADQIEHPRIPRPEGCQRAVGGRKGKRRPGGRPDAAQVKRKVWYTTNICAMQETGNARVAATSAS